MAGEMREEWREIQELRSGSGKADALLQITHFT
jgi:hypothetical protein